MIAEKHSGYVVFPDGREVCTKDAEGRREYVRRRRVAWLAQGKRCAICHLPLVFLLAETDHINPRRMGAGFRDDRPENIRAVHHHCNSERGSQRWA